MDWLSLFTSLPLFGLVLTIISVFIFVAKPKSYWALIFAFALGIIMYYYIGVYNGFNDIAIRPAIEFMIYGGTITLYTFGSILTLVGLIIIAVSALYNIIYSWDKKSVTLWT